MAIRTVVTSGFGNGTFNGTIALVTLRGYISAAAVAIVDLTMPIISLDKSMDSISLDKTMPVKATDLTADLRA